jgi:hypothetical protein
VDVAIVMQREKSLGGLWGEWKQSGLQGPLVSISSPS